MSELKFKYLNEIDISDSLTDSAHVIVEDGGNIRRAPMNQLVAGGGASVQADWNQNDETAPDYVKNRTHWVEGSVETLIENQNFTLKIDENGIAACNLEAITLVAGETYTVVVDGTEHILTAENIFWAETDCVCVGDITVLDDANTSSKLGFMILYAPTYFPDVSMFAMVSDEETHILSLYKSSTTIHTLDEKFIPDTIARVSDIPEGTEQVQPDWTQNDSTQPDYVKNRTHWVEGSGATIEWDGNTEGHEYVDSNNDGSMLWVHVSDITPSMSEFVGSVATVTMTDGSAMSNTITEDGITQYDQSISFGDGAISIAYVDNATMGSFVLPKAGTYFVVNASMYVSKLTYGSTTYHPLDEAFIPDTIARSASFHGLTVPDATGETVTAAEFNALLAALREASYLAT